ncbi:hypothetical protein CPC08DRAFT_706672 [Agrocybe pediades]|nr:hypothetical protein CPC08DRAFT_706672 [Agrocybe pediades]
MIVIKQAYHEMSHEDKFTNAVLSVAPCAVGKPGYAWRLELGRFVVDRIKYTRLSSLGWGDTTWAEAPVSHRRRYNFFDWADSEKGRKPRSEGMLSGSSMRKRSSENVVGDSTGVSRLWPSCSASAVDLRVCNDFVYTRPDPDPQFRRLNNRVMVLHRG